MSLREKSRRSGVAMLLVLVSLALMSVLLIEILFASRVDIRIALNSRNRLQAYYLALSSARLSLLRLHMYKEVKNMSEGAAGAAIPKDIVDKIWSTPLPVFPLIGQDIDWPGQIQASIEAEGSKIPVNALDGNVNRGSSEEKQKSVREEIKRLWESMREDEEFDKLYRGIEAEDLIDALQDWIDPDPNLVKGGEENRDYERMEKPYFPRNDRIPSLTEIHMIKGWTDDLYDRFVKHFSILTNDIAVNPNYVPLERIKSWEPKLSPEDLAAIEKRRQSQPFAKLADLESFIQTSPDIRNGRDFKLPTTYTELDREEIFEIDATGIVGDTRRTLKYGIRFITEASQKKADGSSSTSKSAAKGKGDTASDSQGQGTSQPAEKKGKLLEPYVVTIEEVL